MTTQFIAICDGTRDEIWATGTTEKEALENLWNRVHKYLVIRQAPKTADFTHKELENYFSFLVLNLSKKGGFLRN